MAEEAMAFIASRIFGFDDDEIHIPYQKPTLEAFGNSTPSDKEEKEHIRYQRSTPIAYEMLTPAPAHSHVETSGHARSLLAYKILSRLHDGFDP